MQQNFYALTTRPLRGRTHGVDDSRTVRARNEVRFMVARQLFNAWIFWRAYRDKEVTIIERCGCQTDKDLMRSYTWDWMGLLLKMGD